MRIKKFEAASMKEALEKIKEEMGSDAFILGTKQISKKGPLGFGDRKFLQVTAAIEEEKLLEAPAAKSSGIDIKQEQEEAWHLVGAGNKAAAKAPAAVPTYNAGGRKALSSQPGSPSAGESLFTSGFEAVFESARGNKPLMDPPVKAKREKDQDNRPLRREISEIKDLVREIGAHSPDISPLQRDLTELKGLLYNVIRNQTPFGGKSLNPVLFSQFQKLKDSGMDENVAAKLIQIVDKKLDSSAKDDEGQVLRYLLGLLRQSVDVAEIPRLQPGKPRVMALVGPTGVGKTTTLAKIAAHALYADGKVVLITLDTYRIAAVEQLKTYAGIMQLPIQVALTVNELRQAIQFHQDKSLILIDTAGHSPRNQESMENLQRFFADQQDIEVHLVLSATTKKTDLNEIVSRFGVLEPKYLILSKLDETGSYGALFTQIVKTKKPVSYVTTGQSVPEDFESASKDLLAGLFLGRALESLKGEAR